MNLYGYVGADSINRTDPSGLCIIENWTMHIISNGKDIGPEPGSGWVVFVHCERTFSLHLAGGNFSNSDGGSVDGGREAPQPAKPSSPATARSSLRPSTKQYLCTKLSANGFNVPRTYRTVLADRRRTVDGKNMWNVPEFREAENWLYASGQWRFPSTDGSTRAGVYIHQYSKYLFGNTTDFSQDALNAGLDGIKFADASPAELKEYCDAN